MHSSSGSTVTVAYDDRIVRAFMLASIIFGAVGMLAGVIAASQLNFWQANLGLEYLTFGRLRPLHTNAAIFAFVGNMMFAGIYYSTQRLCKCRLASDFLSWLHFWGWNLIIVAAAITLPLGLTQGKEYAELIWPIDIAVALIWVVFAINFFWTLARRNEPTIYVAIWFYIATIVTVAMLYIVNNLSLPTSLIHSYPVFGGVQDALVQWWYGHNAVAFFLTTPILGIMYYFVPKAADRPVYSYRLSVIHFWSLVFVYIWAGPHHLLNTALPKWLQALGMLFSLMLWAPSWGGMLNGLLTLRGAWHKLRDDPVLKFFAAGVTFYGMSTFEGPLLSIRSINALAHYSDWIIGHVHSGTLGWNGFMAAGMFYWLVPRLWGRELHSRGLANLHFWLGLVGILLYIGAMWVSGITQGLMLNATRDGGTALAYTNFLETLNAIRMPMLFRLIGGGMYLVGWFILIYNITRSILGATPVNTTVQVHADRPDADTHIGLFGTLWNRPVAFCVTGIFIVCTWMFGGPVLSLFGLFGSIVLVLLAIVDFTRNTATWTRWYENLLHNPLPFTLLTFGAAAIGGAIQILPSLTIDPGKSTEGRLQQPYTPLELAGRDIYIQEGCYNCHSQMIRTLVPDVLRYGRPGVKDDYSHLGESIYDHPFQWGSRRTGPDLAHEGFARGDDWHAIHFRDPRALSEGSNMPAYPWLFEKDTPYKALPNRVATLARLGVPYPAWTPNEIQQLAMDQALHISKGLRAPGIDIYIEPDKRVIALIAYIQRLGKHPTLEESIARFSPIPAPDTASSVAGASQPQPGSD